MGLHILDLSLGEVEALIIKAAHGAGFSPGIAAEIGRAARRAISDGEADVPTTILTFLEAVALKPPSPCPVLAALFERDGGGKGPATDPKWDSLRAMILRAGTTDAVTRCALPSDIFARLDHFARMTYAPATEESRSKGAG